MSAWLRSLLRPIDADPPARTSFWILAVIAIVVPFGWLLLLGRLGPLRRALKARRERGLR